MKKTAQTTLPVPSNGDGKEISPAKKNGHTEDQVSDLDHRELAAILSSLQRMRDGDFSVRLPGSGQV